MNVKTAMALLLLNIVVLFYKRFCCSLEYLKFCHGKKLVNY